MSNKLYQTRDEPRIPTPGDTAEENMGTPTSLDRDKSLVVNEVFSMFKAYLESNSRREN